MRVMLVTGSYPPMRCGVGDYTACLLEALNTLPGVTVGVLTSDDPEVAPSGKVDIRTAGGRWRWRDLRQVMQVLREWRPDIVHIQYPTQGYRGSPVPTVLPLLCRLAGLRVVQTWHEARAALTVGAAFWLLCELPVQGGVVFVRPRFIDMLPRALRAALWQKTGRFIPNASVVPAVELNETQRREIRARFAAADAQLVVFFGFLYAAKGVELLFEMADPARQRLVIIGDPVPGDPGGYQQTLAGLADSPRWQGKATLAGFLPVDEVARVIAASDAVVLPFRAGGGEWNTSIHAAQAQGTFVLTTSEERHGFDAESNTYYARPADLPDMRRALALYSGKRNQHAGARMAAQWQAIAQAHFNLYQDLVTG